MIARPWRLAGAVVGQQRAVVVLVRGRRGVSRIAKR